MTGPLPRSPIRIAYAKGVAHLLYTKPSGNDALIPRAVLADVAGWARARRDFAMIAGIGGREIDKQPGEGEALNAAAVEAGYDHGVGTLVAAAVEADVNRAFFARYGQDPGDLPALKHWEVESLYVEVLEALVLEMLEPDWSYVV